MDLLTCPFCANDAPEVVTLPDGQNLVFAVSCAECGMNGPTDASAAFAVDKWNQRAPVLS